MKNGRIDTTFPSEMANPHFQKLFLDGSHSACQNQAIWRIIQFTTLISVFCKSNWFMRKFTIFFNIFPPTYLNYISSIPFISGRDAIFNPGVVNCLFWLETNTFSPFTSFVLYCFPMSHCVYEPWLSNTQLISNPF